MTNTGCYYGGNAIGRPGEYSVWVRSEVQVRGEECKLGVRGGYAGEGVRSVS